MSNLIKTHYSNIYILCSYNSNMNLDFLDILEKIYKPFIALDESQYEALGKLLLQERVSEISFEMLGRILAIGKAYREYNKLPEPKVIEIEENGRGEEKIVILYETLTKHLERKFAIVSYGGNPFVYVKGSYKDERKEIWSEARRLIEKQAGVKLDRKKIAEIEREVKARIIGDTYIRENPFNKLPPHKFVPVKNGVVLNLNGKRILLPSSPAWGFTYCLNVKYDETKDCPKIKQFIQSLIPKDHFILYEAIAAALLPVYQYQGNYMLVGSGSNGKSTFLTLLRDFLGPENVASISLQELVNNRFKPAELFGKLANIYADLPDEALRHTGIFKMLTGGDQITVEKKYQHPFQFVNRARMYFSANVLPEVNDETYAFWRRWIVIEFPFQFDENPNLIKEITSEDEKSGLLNIVLDTLNKIVEQGLTKTGLVEEMREKWRERSNPVYAFVKNCVTRDPNSFETKDEVYSAYVDFCNMKDLRVLPKNIFAMELQRLIDVKTTRKKIAGQRVMCWEGIKLKCDECELYKECRSKGGEDEGDIDSLGGDQPFFA